MAITDNLDTGPDDTKSSTEDIKRLQRLLTKLESNPSINCPITFVGDFTEESANAIATSVRIQALLQREDFPWMDFGRLKQVVFHHDYKQGIRDAAGNHPNVPVPTEEAGGTSMGMVVRNGNGVKLVLHEGIGHALVCDDAARLDFAINAVRHELCHVHDIGFKLALIERHPDKHTVSGFNSCLFPLVESLWDEYFANKYSCGPWTCLNDYSRFLCEAIPTIKNEVIQEIRGAQMYGDLETLCAAVVPKVRFIAQCFGYVMGTIAALETTVIEHEPDLARVLREFGLHESWDDCYSQLENLDRKRPEWGSVLDLVNLVYPCAELMAAFGLHYRPNGDEAYLDVPYIS